MKNSLFITGATGFVGRNFLKKIAPDKYDTVYCLGRKKKNIGARLSRYRNIKFIQADILDTNAYKSFLEKSNVVVHFAAATGKLKPKEYFRINAEGTNCLVNQCKKSGVTNFLYISTIAAKFPIKTNYYYAQSKLKGELIVKKSGLLYTIVRPTIIIGRDSAIWKGLSQIAGKPVAIIFGKGNVNIQPIFIDDLTQCILTIIEEKIFENQLYELGGPESLTIEDLICRIHKHNYSKDPRVIHIPMNVLVNVLSLLEKPFSTLLPLNVGQLASFRNNGTIEKNIIFQRFENQMKTVDEMLNLVIDKF